MMTFKASLSGSLGDPWLAGCRIKMTQGLKKASNLGYYDPYLSRQENTCFFLSGIKKIKKFAFDGVLLLSLSCSIITFGGRSGVQRRTDNFLKESLYESKI